MHQAPSPAEQPAVPSIGSVQKETASVTSPAISMPRMSQPENPYDFDACTIVAVVQLRPKREARDARQILLSVQNGAANQEDLPLYHLLTEDELGGPFPPALVALFEELAHQLLERKQRHEQRLHMKASSTPSNPAQKAIQTSKEKSSQQKKPTASTVARDLPPVPTTTPSQKNDLVLGGFDWFQAE